MEIKKLFAWHNDEYLQYSFFQKNMIVSSKNKSGKTTVLRMIPWALGFKNHTITDKIDVKKLHTKLELIVSDKKVIIERTHGKVIVIKENSEKVFSLPNDYYDYISWTFNIDFQQFELNSFGFLIDQDNGWKIINRGKINYNSRYFVLERDLKLLNATQEKRREIYDDFTELNELKKQKESIKNIVKTIEKTETYHLQIDEDQTEVLSHISFLNKKLKNLIDLRNGLEDRKKRILSIKNIIIDNNISVQVGEKIIKLEHENLIFSTINNNWIELKIGSIESEVSRIRRKINELNSSIDGQINLFSTKNKNDITLPTSMKMNVVRNNIDKMIMEKQLSIKNKTTSSHVLENRFIELIDEVCKFVNVDPRKILSGEKWKGVSGSRRMILVLAIRIAYNQILKEFLKINIPLIIDSPAANEFDENSINKINQMLNKIHSQIIIATLDDGKIKIEGNFNKIKIERAFHKNEQLKLELD